ncbi:hypothetical protein MVEN_02259400 [Mycena venus]|uniref:T6SS Phospholipase effector Tle1-like catalytic domain-containing protein n=1 Tax=Mycena venus TaxID=2733690 RepID=A0A8H6X5W1_9AGAR|nr:hypothetical protein MVEN_02259400 [Mycena venus]
MSTPSRGHMIRVPTDATMVEHTGESPASGRSRSGSEETAVPSPQICVSSTVVPPDNKHRCLILCFDGTWDQFSTHNSNVVQLVSALEKDDREKQMVYYQSGIGTYTAFKLTPLLTKLSLITDAAIGWNLAAHIIGGYEFLMQNYKDGDRICIFGFSRGAYIARSLAGMLDKVGLLPADNHEQVPFAYRMYARKNPASSSDAFKKTFSKDVQIQFIGVWDTVESVGLIPKSLPFAESNTIVRTFRHAVSLDERRAKFQPNLWDYDDKSPKVPQPSWALPILRMRKHFRKSSEPEVDDDTEQMNFEPAYGQMHPTDILEVYFAGCHCDVGGGSVGNDMRPSLARIPLRWMIRECFEAKTGMMFNAQRLQELGLNPATLYKHEDGYLRFPKKSLHIPDGLRIDPRKSRKCQESPAKIRPMEEEDLTDALESSIHDSLTRNPFWWILEVIPFTFRYKSRPDNKLHTEFRPNLWRARKIPLQKGHNGNPLAHDYKPPMNLKVHRSVEVRKKACDAKGRPFYKNRADFKGLLDYVD